MSGEGESKVHPAPASTGIEGAPDDAAAAASATRRRVFNLIRAAEERDGQPILRLPQEGEEGRAAFDDWYEQKQLLDKYERDKAKLEVDLDDARIGELMLRPAAAALFPAKRNFRHWFELAEDMPVVVCADLNAALFGGSDMAHKETVDHFKRTLEIDAQCECTADGDPGAGTHAWTSRTPIGGPEKPEPAADIKAALTEARETAAASSDAVHVLYFGRYERAQTLVAQRSESASDSPPTLVFPFHMRVEGRGADGARMEYSGPAHVELCFEAGADPSSTMPTAARFEWTAKAETGAGFDAPGTPMPGETELQVDGSIADRHLVELMARESTGVDAVLDTILMGYADPGQAMLVGVADAGKPAAVAGQGGFTKLETVDQTGAPAGGDFWCITNCGVETQAGKVVLSADSGDRLGDGFRPVKYRIAAESTQASHEAVAAGMIRVKRRALDEFGATISDAQAWHRYTSEVEGGIALERVAGAPTLTEMLEACAREGTAVKDIELILIIHGWNPTLPYVHQYTHDMRARWESGAANRRRVVLPVLWPSEATWYRPYATIRNTVPANAAQLRPCLAELRNLVSSVSCVAHSMGNHLLGMTMALPAPPAAPALNRIALCAADVDYKYYVGLLADAAGDNPEGCGRAVQSASAKVGVVLSWKDGDHGDTGQDTVLASRWFSYYALGRYGIKDMVDGSVGREAPQVVEKRFETDVKMGHSYMRTAKAHEQIEEVLFGPLDDAGAAAGAGAGAGEVEKGDKA